MLDIKSPFEEALKAYKAGTDVRAQEQNIALSQEEQRLTEQKRAGVVQAQEKARKTQEILAGLEGKDLRAEDYADLIIKLPEMKDHFKASFDIMNESGKQSALEQSSNIFSAVQSGNLDMAKELIQEYKEGAKNSGDTEKVKRLEAIEKMADLNPKSLEASTGLLLASVIGPEKFTEAYKSIIDKPNGGEKFDVLTDDKTGEAVTVLFDKFGNVIKKSPIDGIRRSQALTPEQQAEITTATTEASQEVLEKFKKEEEKRKTIKSKDYRDVSEGLNSIDKAISIFSKNPGLKSISGELSRKMGRGDAGEFEAEIKTATDIITRIRTGAALNEKEISFYNTVYSPKWYNDEKTANYKLNKLQQIYKEAQRRMINSDSEQLDIKLLFSDTVKKFEKDLGRALTIDEINELKSRGEL